MNFLSNLSYYLNKFPMIKRVVKRAYQLGTYMIFPKIKSEGALERVSPNDGYEYFFGYYDKSPWDLSDRYMLCLRAKETSREVAPKEPADIILIDTQNNNSYRILATTHSWNVQQGCMLQWLGPDYTQKIIYNDFIDGKFCSVILDIDTLKEKVYPMPVYSVSSDGKFALTLNFARLHRLRKGYGYSNLEEETRNLMLPDRACIWRIDFESEAVTPLLKYTDFSSFEPRIDMENAEHKVNHIMISPDNKRFMVLHRWFLKQKKYTRLVTCNCDGTEIYNLSDDDMVSHCYWKSNTQILAFENKNSGSFGYYLMKDKTQQYVHQWPELFCDGHPSYSPDGQLVVTDTYPDKSRLCSIMVAEGDVIRTVARVFAPFLYDNDVRCDLHPRWNRAGDTICFDGAFEGKRGLYIVRLKSVQKE